MALAPSLKEQRRYVKHKAASREIFIAAARAINKNHTTSLASVAEELGGTRGTIYYYFKTKGELLYKMQQYLHEQVAAAIKPIISDEHLPALTRLKKAMHAFTLVELEHNELVRALWTDASLYEQPPRLREMTMKRIDSFYEQMETLILEVCREENLRIIDIKAAARMIFSIPDTICRWYQPASGKLSARKIADYLTAAISWGFFMPNVRTARLNDNHVNKPPKTLPVS